MQASFQGYSLFLYIIVPRTVLDLMTAPDLEHFEEQEDYEFSCYTCQTTYSAARAFMYIFIPLVIRATHRPQSLSQACYHVIACSRDLLLGEHEVSRLSTHVCENICCWNMLNLPTRDCRKRLTPREKCHCWLRHTSTKWSFIGWPGLFQAIWSKT